MKTGRPVETISLEDKFWSFVIKKGKDDCWVWLGTLYTQGYGRFYHHSLKETKAHRVSYLLHFGEIPKNSLICHKCNNHKCVNPNHLYAGTNDDNMKDLSVSGILKGENNPASKLTENLILQIRKEYLKSGITTRFLSKKHNVSQGLISKVIRGDCWKHVGGPTQQAYVQIKYANLSLEEIKKTFRLNK
jgi:hypothetical protein